MLDDLAAFVSLTIPTRGEEGEVIVAGALLRHPPLPRCGRGAGGEGSPSPSPPYPSALTRGEERGGDRRRGASAPPPSPAVRERGGG